MLMKWIKIPLLLIVLLGFPLFQLDQAFDGDWLVWEDPLVLKSGHNILAPTCIWGDPVKTVSAFASPMRLISQLRNPLSVLHDSFRRTSPFWKPPPSSACA